MERIETDVLVIGSGIAGLVLAKLVAPRARVTVVTKKDDTESSTNLAQGGIAAVVDPADSLASHVEDTLTAGDGLCDRRAVEVMVEEGPELVRRLVDWGARFSRTPDGAAFELGMEGGHSRRRIVHSQDRTGREVERALVTSVRQEPSVSIVEHHLAVSLRVTGRGRGRRAVGAIVLDDAAGRLAAYDARVTVLATGGIGRCYLHTTNPAIATGDGIAMAYRIGAQVADLEFVQFHPTMFYAPDRPESFLISEAVRGEGAVLVTQAGREFMDAYHPRGCLAPRDIVARAIALEMQKSGDPCVLLDATRLGGDFFRRRFPFIAERCLAAGLDPARVPIPVVPAAHYSCGGVRVDLHARTNVAGLYATGEVSSTGVHGANRLASNSLLEALVWSRRAAADIAARLPGIPSGGFEEPDREFAVGPDPDPFPVAELLLEVRKTLWEDVGILRSDVGLSRAVLRIGRVLRKAEERMHRGRLWPELVTLRNVAQVALLVARSARMRKESRGLHHNADHPEKDDANWKRATVIA
ncbi:MAG: L-aspartate oxidase [Planctomycetes bacterium]|nr:L-aspartate oxidase [Planctomycetota bacterium]